MTKLVSKCATRTILQHPNIFLYSQEYGMFKNLRQTQRNKVIASYQLRGLQKDDLSLYDFQTQAMHLLTE